MLVVSGPVARAPDGLLSSLELANSTLERDLGADAAGPAGIMDDLRELNNKLGRAST